MTKLIVLQNPVPDIYNYKPFTVYNVCSTRYHWYNVIDQSKHKYIQYMYYYTTHGVSNTYILTFAGCPKIIIKIVIHICGIL